MQEDQPQLNSQNLEFVEGLYEDFSRDPSTVPEDWRSYFEGLDNGIPDGGLARFKPSFAPPTLFNPAPHNGHPPATVTHDDNRARLQYQIDKLVRNFRVRGHSIAHLNPLEDLFEPKPIPSELDLATFDIREEDMDIEVKTLVNHGENLTVRQVVQRLQNTYCRCIAVHFMHIDELEVRDWLQERMEKTENSRTLSREEQIRIFTRLTDATTFEEFIQKKFVGAKSFSLEGAESLIPLLDSTIERAGDQGIEEIVIGMPHRGRLNVLVNIMKKSPQQIFREFEDSTPEKYEGRGDVKYHLGAHTNWTTASGKTVHLALCFNPSHLEFVGPVALGRTRAQQDRTGDRDGKRSMTLLMHGDAAFAGEGVVQETLNLSQLDAYKTGGTLHVIVNNQIGFTTCPSESRSTAYATDIARMLQIPIFHVNGEDPEAVEQAVYLAMEFRQEFERDVVIDMYCYRRRGHNESDEPAFTQPLMYRAIKQRKPVWEGYLEHLLTLGGITREEADEISAKRRKHLEDELAAARSTEEKRPESAIRTAWSRYRGGPDRETPNIDTCIADVEKLRLLLEATTKVPETFNLHPKLKRFHEKRIQMARGEIPLDWAGAEALAFATLAVEGHRIRFTGQDSRRGTFSHRHAVLTDYETGEIYEPLNHLVEDQAPVEIHNSPLSETAVLAYEYGYSLAYPDGLTLWEAQFGDFFNVAQVIIDQFLASAEDKWRSLSNIVLLLPHGFEGMGPEHSSARLERFVSLSAEDNFQVVTPTTPVQYFHVLRRQVIRTWRKPLIVMSPKSLLRHPKAVSHIEEFTKGRFERILPDDGNRIKGVRRILMCMGKIYYELLSKREETGRDDLAIVRVEQVYPLQPEDLYAVLEPYEAETPVYWVQEEPENMGAWRRMKGKFGQRLLGKLPFTVVSRPASASPATGSPNSHKLEQARILDKAFSSEATSWF